MKLVLTLLVRDEEDILETYLAYHFERGVDHVIATDNRSVDRTRSILEAHAQSGRLTLIDEPADDYSQWRWVTRMARLAATELDADWVIHSDADELWWCAERSFKDALASVRPDVSAVSVSRLNAVPRPVDGRPFSERLVYFETQPTNAFGAPLRPKVCHRGRPDVLVEQGNHAVHLGGALAAPAPCALEIFHFPMRTYEQLERKIRNGGAAYARNTELPFDVGDAWRALYRRFCDGELKSWYHARVLGDTALARALAEGSVFCDTRLRDHLRALR